ncbi:MAG: NAD-dependent epimerase/dehydratase family protein [Gammaproteobacteria bacterium]|nr:MAG: NAD-dependent epimerase/dehydratase family protein [Gammaproteobacteria bacterium]
MSKVVAITGGTGFVGRHLVSRHVALGDEVRYLTRSLDGGALPGAIPYVGDLVSDREILESFVEGVDVLYHCAAELLDSSRMEATNVIGTRNLLLASQNKIGRWVQLSSVGVYGLAPGCNIYEDSPLNPGNPYEKSKAQADSLVLDAAKRAGLQAVILRPSNIYGQDMPNKSLFQLIRMIDKGFFFYIGPPGAYVNYVHVENVVDALVMCGKRKIPQNGRVYIISDNLPLDTFVECIAKFLGQPEPKFRMPLILAKMAVSLCGGIPNFPLSKRRIMALTDRTVYSSRRITKELGFNHRISLKEGIASLVEEYMRGQR